MSDSSNPLSMLSRPGNRRWVAIVRTAVCAAGIWGVSRWASAPTYVPLYRGLELN